MGAIFDHAKYQYHMMKIDWELYVEAEYNRALEECAGVLINRTGMFSGIDGYSLFMGPESRVKKYASEELLAYFAHNPRLTAAEFEEQWFNGVGQLI